MARVGIIFHWPLRLCICSRLFVGRSILVESTGVVVLRLRGLNRRHLYGIDRGIIVKDSERGSIVDDALNPFA